VNVERIGTSGFIVGKWPKSFVQNNYDKWASPWLAFMLG